MNIVQSIPVDTSKFTDGAVPIASEISSLKDYLRAHPEQLYATPQLIDAENPLAIIVLRMRRKNREQLMTLINPMILATKDIIATEEEQAGIEGVYLNFRHPQIHIAYNALPLVTPTEMTLTGKSALIFQQALRLTQGIPINTFGLRVDDYEEYKNADEAGKQEIIFEYSKALKDFQQELLEDDEVNEYVKATEFMAEKVQASVNAEFKGQLQDAYEEIKDTRESSKSVGGSSDV